MERLRRSPCAVARRLCRAVERPPPGYRAGGDPGFRLDPSASHALLATPGAAAAVVDALLAATRAAVREMTAAAGAAPGAAGRPAGGVAVPLVRAVTTLAWALGNAVEHCRCADEAVVPPLAAALPDVYAPLRGWLGAASNDVTVSFFRALDGVLMAYVQDANMMGGVPEARRTPACVAAPPYSAARARVTALVASASPLLHVWVVEASSVAAAQLAAGAPMDGLPPRCLCLLSAVGPRRLLDDVPDAVAAIARAAGVLASAPAPLCLQAVLLQGSFVLSLLMLTLVDPQRLRVVDGIAGILAAVEAPLPWGGPHAHEALQCRSALYEVFCVLLADAGALAASPDSLGLLVRWAAGGATPLQAWLSERAASMALFVGVQALLRGADRLPPTLQEARSMWARLTRSHPDGTTTKVASLLSVLATRGAAALPAVTAALPWPPVLLPVTAQSVYHQDTPAICWACGCSWRVPPADGGRALRACGRCRVATYCSAPCAAAHWRGGGGHRRSCSRWAAYRAALLPLRRDAVAVTDPDGAGLTARDALFPVLSLHPRALVGPPEQWAWPPSEVDRVEGWGLALADVVTVMDPLSCCYKFVPADEYAHWPSAVPAATLDRVGRHNGGEVRQVVMRTHPPLVFGFPANPDRGASR